MSLSPALILESLEPWRQASRWWVGLSGGLDSTVLLHLLSQLRRDESLPPIHAVHVDHQLSRASVRWQQFCVQLCARLDIELECRQVEVSEDGRGVEAAARAARYRVFEELIGPGELLLLAHHRDDQVETFFLRLLRGAGTRGLSGMPRHRSLGAGALMRPLLDLHRSDLEAYALEHSLGWAEDDSNRDQSLDRNYLRHAVLPLLEQRWPGYRQSVDSALSAIAEAEEALAAVEQPLLDAALGGHFGEATLDLKALVSLPGPELGRVLRRWLILEGLEPPGRARLEEFVRQLQTSDPEAQPQLSVADWVIRRYQSRLYLCRGQELAPPQEALQLLPGTVLEIPGLGQLEMLSCSEGGLRLPLNGAWEIRFRQGGERCQPLERTHSQSLKKLLQEYAVPPWWRNRLPLLYTDGELAAIADLCVCQGTHSEDADSGYKLAWRKNSTAMSD